MVSANQVRELVSQYLRDVVDLEVFASRFALLSDDIEDSSDDDAIRLSYKIESFLADVSAGIVTESHLRETLIPCLTVVEITPEYQAKEVIFTKEASSGFFPLEMSLT